MKIMGLGVSPSGLRCENEVFAEVTIWSMFGDVGR